MCVSFRADSVQRLAHRCTQCTEAHMASIQRIVSPLTKDVSYRAQVRVRGRSCARASRRHCRTGRQRKPGQPRLKPPFERGVTSRTPPRSAPASTRRQGLRGDGPGGVRRVAARGPHPAAQLVVQAVCRQERRRDNSRRRLESARRLRGGNLHPRQAARRDKKTGEIIAPKEYRRSGATVNRLR